MMQRPANDNPLAEGNPFAEKGPLSTRGVRVTPSGEGGLAATIEAASKHKVPAPSGKGVAMVILAVMVMAAVVYEVATHDSDVAQSASEDESKDGADVAGTGDAQGEPTDAIDLGAGSPEEIVHTFRLPGDLSAEVASALTQTLARAAQANPKVFEPALAELSKRMQAVPDELLPATRKDVLAHLARIADGPARGAALRAAMPLVGSLPAERLREARRLTLVAELTLDDPTSAEAGLAYIRQLPESARPIPALEALVLDDTRTVKQRMFAALAIPSAMRSDALQSLADHEDTPAQLRAALLR